MLTPKQKLFVAEYLKNPDASKAARAAGYSAKTAGSQGHDLLKKPEIAAAVAKRVEAVAMSADDVLLEMATVAKMSINPDTVSAKVAALAWLGKHHKLWSDAHVILVDDARERILKKLGAEEAAEA